MSITDELRAFAASEASDYDDWVDGIRAIADRIDAEHRAALEKLAAQVDESERIGFDQGFASADDWLAQHEDAMADHGWVKLPVDADGEPIRVGDRLDGYGKTIEVVELRSGRGGWMLMSRGGYGYVDTFAFVHHHAPTVKDVLLDFGWGWHEHMDEPETFDITEYVERYAAKLRLAEEVDA